jgi:oligoendopeptidase F
MFAEFEKITHNMVDNGESLTADKLCDIYYDLNKLYFGPDVYVDEEIKYEWSRIPHFYSEFYVYQYATGFSAAIALSKRILELGDVAVSDYMKFLTGGSSKYPIDLLKDAGVDMSTPAPINAAMELFEELLNELETLV